VILFKRQIDILLFIGFSGFPINRMLYLLFFILCNGTEHLKNIKEKKTSTQKYINPSFLKRFRRFFIGGLYGLLLETKHLDDLLFVITQY